MTNPYGGVYAGGGGGGSSSSPAVPLNLAISTDGSHFLTMQPSTYGDTYPNGYGTVAAWVFGAYNTDYNTRDDLAFFSGYNLSAVGQVADPTEFAWMDKMEILFFAAKGLTFTCTSSNVTNSVVVRTAGAQTSPFSATDVNGCVIEYPSGNRYPIITYTNANQVTVRGNANAETQAGAVVLYPQIEHYETVFWPVSDTSVRCQSRGYRLDNEAIDWQFRGYQFAFQHEDQTPMFSFSSTGLTLNQGSIFHGTNNVVALYGVRTNGSTACMMLLDNTNDLLIGQGGGLYGMTYFGCPVLAGNDAITGMILGNASTTAGAYGETKILSFLRTHYSGIAYTDYDHISIRIPDDGADKIEMRFGLGAWAAMDTNLYRRAANQLKTDDKFLAAVGIGVGNSASATSLGTLSKKIEVFDAVGASIGFLPVYTTIT